MNTNDIYELHKKAENGDINAQKELADLYIDAPSQFLQVMNGHFMAIDPIKTAYWLRKAALGDAEAQYRIGVCYEEGEGVLTQDVYAAVNYFIAATKQGYSPARSALFERYPNALVDPDNVLINIPASDIYYRFCFQNRREGIEDCSALTEIINWNATPANISDTAFMNVDKAQCVLRVPACSVETYRTIDGWKDFRNIESII